MNPERYRRVSELFQQAIALPAEERGSFLDEACAGDSKLRQEVELLLHHDESSADHGDAFADDRVAAADGWREALVKADSDASTDEPPEEIGPFQILELIGEGGMGQVYHGRQEVPIKREVAIKLIKRGMDSEQILRRFALEREALERMQHSHIARLLDAGMTPSGRPYFAMEFVPGRSIIEHCDEKQLGLRERLELFVKVARAIQHAHQKGILHRDIKPSNVLVSEAEGTALPKVIDFGLARAIEVDPSALTSRAGQVLGTPAYMSPEQANPGQSEVDSRTDVYSLGVLLYEILTGELPFENQLNRPSDGGSRGGSSSRRSVERPSSRFTSVDDGTVELAKRRSSNVRSLKRQLRGDLDWIVLMATEPDLTRRYASASELAADVERYLATEPVLAGPPSALYRLRKFYQRQRVLAYGGSLFLIFLIVALVTTTKLYKRASEAEADALDLLDDERARNDIFSHMLVTADPRQTGKDAKVVDLLQRGSDYTLDKYGDRPRIAAVVLLSLGQTFRELGDFDAARDCTMRAVELRRSQEDVSPRELSFAINSQALLHKRLGEYQEAESCYREAITLSESDPDRDVESLRSLAASNYNLGRILVATNKLEEAEPFLLRARALQEEHSPDDHEVQAFGNAGLAELYSGLGNSNLAIEYAQASVEHARVAFSKSHPHLATSLSFLGAIQSRMGQDEIAESTFKESLEIARRAFPEQSPSLKAYVDRLLTHYIGTNQTEEAESLIDESFALAQASELQDPTQLAFTRGYLGQLLLAKGDPEGAIFELEEALIPIRQSLGAQHDYVVNLEEALQDAKDRATAAGD